VQLVGARARDEHLDAAPEASVFGIVVGGDQLELAELLGSREVEDHAARLGNGLAGAVQQNLLGATARTRNRSFAVAGVDARHVGDERLRVANAAREQRQRVHEPAREVLAALRGLRLQQDDRLPHFHRLHDIAELQAQVHDLPLRHADFDVALRGPLEAGLLDRQRVRPHRQAGEHEQARIGGHGLELLLRGFVPGHHFGGGNRCARGIRHRPLQRAGSDL
jgi:hypothetical protein